MAKTLSTPPGLRRALAWWPPYRFAGIKVLDIADDWSSARVRLRLGRLNRNYFGTHFGGSLYSMSDPFWALLAVNRLGKEYVVWDKAGEIEYVTPGRGDVFAEFKLTEDRLEEIRAATADGDKALPWFDSEVTTADGTVVARVRKQLSTYAVSPPAAATADRIGAALRRSGRGRPGAGAEAYRPGAGE